MPRTARPSRAACQTASAGERKTLKDSLVWMWQLVPRRGLSPSRAQSWRKASTAPAVPPAAPAPAGDPRNFGFTPAQLHTAAPVGPEAVQAHIAQIADRAGRAY